MAKIGIENNVLNSNALRNGWISNIGITSATTTNADDSIRLTSGTGAALSATNVGFICIATGGGADHEVFEVTSNVTINLTGAHWGAGGNGDLTGAILRVLAINDNGSLRIGVALQGGRTTISDTLDSTTGTDINLPEEILVNTNVANADSYVVEIGWFRANFDDTGGAAEDLWTLQTGREDLNLGSADGFWAPWNPAYTGFSANPSSVISRWTMVGNTVILRYHGTAGTSSTTGFTMTSPIKALDAQTDICIGTDNGAVLTTPSFFETLGNSTTLRIDRDFSGAAWTAANGKLVEFSNAMYEAGP